MTTRGFGRRAVWLALAALTAACMTAGCGCGSREAKEGEIQLEEPAPPPAETAAPETPALEPDRYPARLTVEAYPARGKAGTLYERRADGHFFDAKVRVFDSEGAPLRGLTRESFDFTMDGVFGRSGLGRNDDYRVLRDYHGVPLGVDVLLDGSDATRFQIEKLMGGNGPVTDWLCSFMRALPVASIVNLHVASGDTVRKVASFSRRARSADCTREIAALEQVATSDAYRKCGNIGHAAEMLAETYRFGGERVIDRPDPRVLLVISTTENLEACAEMPRARKSLQDRHLVVGVVPFGVGRPANLKEALLSNAPEYGAQAAAVLASRAAPFYRFQLRLAPGRLRPDGLQHKFVIKTAHADAYGDTSIKPMLFELRGRSTWLIAIVVGGLTVLLMLAIAGAVLIYMSLRRPVQEVSADDPFAGRGPAADGEDSW